MNVSSIGSAQDTILVIGNIEKWQDELWEVPLKPALRYASFDKLEADLLSWVQPDIVVVPLISSRHDAFDVLARLSELEYQGRFLAIGKALPNVEMVQGELRRRAPGIDAKVVLVADRDP